MSTSKLIKKMVCYFVLYPNHFDKIKKEAIKLIKEGKAFMDDTPQEHEGERELGNIANTG